MNTFINMANIPSTFNWDFKIIGDLSDDELTVLKRRAIKIKGNPCELVQLSNDPIEFIFQDLDDFLVTTILNKMTGKPYNIEIARLNNKHEPIIKHSYFDCKIIASHSFNSRLDANSKLYGKISVTFDYKGKDFSRIIKDI